MKTQIKKICLVGNGLVVTRAVNITDDKWVVKDKQRKPFELKGDLLLEVYLKNGEVINIEAHNGYIYDGATIPFKIGKGNMKLLYPALFHDIMCETPSIVNYRRKLSSEIFYELLVTFQTNKIVAYGMFCCVELFQKITGKWHSEV